MRSRRLTAVSWEQRAGNLNVADDKSDRPTGEVQVPALISTQPALHSTSAGCFRRVTEVAKWAVDHDQRRTSDNLQAEFKRRGVGQGEESRQGKKTLSFCSRASLSLLSSNQWSLLDALTDWVANIHSQSQHPKRQTASER